MSRKINFSSVEIIRSTRISWHKEIVHPNLTNSSTVSGRSFILSILFSPFLLFNPSHTHLLLVSSVDSFSSVLFFHYFPNSFSLTLPPVQPVLHFNFSFSSPLPPVQSFLFFNSFSCSILLSLHLFLLFNYFPVQPFLLLNTLSPVQHFLLFNSLYFSTLPPVQFYLLSTLTPV